MSSAAIVFLAVSSISFMSFVPAMAAPKCEHTSAVSSNGAGKPVLTDSAAHLLSEEHFFNVRGTLLKVPFGYLNPWPSTHLEKIAANPKDGDATHKIPGLAFAFWMPNLRYSELDRFNTPWYRPCEKGRTIPQDGEYIVEASLSSPWLPLDTPGLQLPAQSFNKRIARQNGDMKLAAEFGLRRTTGGPFILYGAEASGDDPEVSVRCWREPQEFLNPSCLGEFLWRNDRLGLTIRFPQSEISNWSDIAVGARTLLYRWRENAYLHQ
ncbi:hypothetical protein [Candidatus Phyllobacterium onerii]|uniref:hypothetical protein n=1 Tax=Candidatus Phyllobacterium onerii TaxID=3020828 RepID=UPI00232FDB7C|nr:hypothetical protein [Phyllobacterium sp. IY22]